MEMDVTSLESARALDAADPLRALRNEFYLPKTLDGQDEIYLVGNSLGLQARRTEEYLQNELQQWRVLGVRGHFEGESPWMPYHELLTRPMAQLVGACDDEVVMMNSLTVNLHLMLATFFRPAGRKRKIMIEANAFPSDYCAVESQLKWHGLDPQETLVQLRPDEGLVFSTESILHQIEEQADELALILLPGVQYYSGQFFELQKITEVAHRHQIQVGFDLAHAVGNVPLELHDWDVDFAVWCSYKYLNSGPGSVGGCFIHQRHIARTDLNRLAGWWGHDKSSRFLMKTEFQPIPTAEGWQLSNPSILSLASIRAALSVFEQAGGMARLREKSLKLTGFLEKCLQARLPQTVEIISPLDPNARGCQLSLAIDKKGVAGKDVHKGLSRRGIRTDWREPNGIRCAPVPLYNSFEDVWGFVDGLAAQLDGE